MKKLLIIGSALTVLALANAQDAHADEASFINAVGNYGVMVAPITLTLGHQVCYDVSVNGTSGFDNETRMAINADVSAHDASVIMVEAIYQLCPSNMVALDAWLATPDQLHTAV